MMSEAEVEGLRSHLHRLREQPSHAVGHKARVDYAIMCAAGESVRDRSDAAPTLAQEILRLRQLIGDLDNG